MIHEHETEAIKRRERQRIRLILEAGIASGLIDEAIRLATETPAPAEDAIAILRRKSGSQHA